MSNQHALRDTAGARNEQGMNTAEYAVGTVSACGFGGLLYKILTSDWAENLLKGIVDSVTGILPL